MNRFLPYLCLAAMTLLGCRKENSVPAVIDTTAKVTAAPADTSSFLSIRYLQLQRKEDSSGYFTTQDCRCTQGTAVFTATGELTFATCDSVPPEGRYAMRRFVKDPTGITVFANHRDTADTITFRRMPISPTIYEIRRSNYFDIESGTLFIDSRDSAKFEHQEWNCEEYQG
jgi:hypothetical protein